MSSGKSPVDTLGQKVLAAVGPPDLLLDNTALVNRRSLFPVAACPATAGIAPQRRNCEGSWLLPLFFTLPIAV